MVVRLIVLLALLKESLASFCGSSAVPFSLEVMPDGQPVLGCAQPSCFGWAEGGQMIAGHFYRINGRQDGFFRNEDRASWPRPRHVNPHQQYHVECEETFRSETCVSDNQWVGGIAPLMNVSTAQTFLQCCTFEPLRLSEDRGLAVVKSGQIVIGGEVLNGEAFDYISNVEKEVSVDGTVAYNVGVRRFYCPPPLDAGPKLMSSEATKKNTQPFARQPFRNRAFQDPNLAVGDPLPADGLESNALDQNYQQQQFAQPAYQAQQPYYGGGGGGEEGGNNFCFTGDTKTRLITGEEKRLDELEGDDWVQTLKDGQVTYARISFWLHRVPSQKAEFIRLELSDGTELKLTSKHFIYRTECAVEKEQVTADGISREAVLAEKVVEGDCLYEVVEGKHLRTTRVTKVSTVTETGIYSPMTSNGKIVVNGIYASCHNVVQSYSLQNTYFSYADRLRKLYASIFGTKSDIAELPMGTGIITSMLEFIIPKDLVTL